MARPPAPAARQRTEFQKNLELILRDSLMTAARFADFVLERADPARMTELRSLYGSKVSTSAERDPAPSDHGVL